MFPLPKEVQHSFFFDWTSGLREKYVVIHVYSPGTGADSPLCHTVLQKYKVLPFNYSVIVFLIQTHRRSNLILP